MKKNRDKPREYDAVLGGKNPPPVNAAVLGGIEGVKMRLASDEENVRVAAVSEALKYGDAGLDLVIEALYDKSDRVSKAAYLLLQFSDREKAKQALLEYEPWQFFECLQNLVGHTRKIEWLCISPNGNFLVSISGSMLVIWNLRAGSLINYISKCFKYNYPVISPDNTTIVAACDNRIEFFDLHSRQVQRTLKEHSGLIRSLQISADGKSIVSYSQKEIKIWDWDTGNCLHTYEVYRRGLAIITPDGNNFIASTDKNLFKIRDLRTGSIQSEIYSSVANYELVGTAIAPDGKKIIVAQSSHNIYIADLDTGEILQTINAGFEGQIRCAAIASDGQTIVSSDSTSIKVWNWQTNELENTINKHLVKIDSLTIAPDAKTVVSADASGIIKASNLRTGRLKCSFGTGHSRGMVESLSITADGKTLVSSGADRTIKIWDWQKGICRRTLEGHSGAVLGVAISPDGKTIVSGSIDGTVKIWNARTGTLKMTLEGGSDLVRRVAIAPNGKVAANSSYKFAYEIWDLQTFTCLANLQEASYNCLAFGPDSTTIATSSRSHTIKLWDWPTGRCLQTLEGHSNCVSSIAISSDGRILVSGSADNTVKVWELHSGRCLRTFAGHSSNVDSIAISADSRIIVSGSWDNTAKIWDLHSGKLYRTLRGHSESVVVAIAPDCQTIFSGSTSIIKVWGLRLE